MLTRSPPEALGGAPDEGTGGDSLEQGSTAWRTRERETIWRRKALSKELGAGYARRSKRAMARSVSPLNCTAAAVVVYTLYVVYVGFMKE